jgi:hypothetical protein
MIPVPSGAPEAAALRTKSDEDDAVSTAVIDQLETISKMFPHYMPPRARSLLDHFKITSQ